MPERWAGHSVTRRYERVPAGEPFDIPLIDPLKYQRPGAVAADANRDEAMTVKVRYKLPDGDTSALLSVPVPIKASENAALGFASAVAEFGLVLRDSEFKGASSFSEALALAQRFKGDDPHGHRAEFIRLIRGRQHQPVAGAVRPADAPTSSARVSTVV